MKGDKLNGEFVLVRLKDEKNWLLIKHKDAFSVNKIYDAEKATKENTKTIGSIRHGKATKIKGYIKPMLTDTKLIGKDDGFIGVLWEGFVGFFKFILKNQRTDTLATKVPLEGDLNNLDAGTWPTIINIFGNAWIKAFKGETDDEIDFKDALDKAKDDANKAAEKEERTEARQNRKMDRKEARERRKAGNKNI